MLIGPTAAGSPAVRPLQPALDKPVAPTVGSGDAASTAGFYPSPVYHMDPLAKVAVVEFRNHSTGAVTDQIPSAKVVAQYQRQGGYTPLTAPSATSSEAGTAGGTASTKGTGTAAGQTEGAATSGASTPAEGATPAAAPAPAVASPAPAVASAAAASGTGGRVSVHA